jgi:hypothetical protein
MKARSPIMAQRRRARLSRIYSMRWWRKQRDLNYNLGLRSDGRPRLTDRRPMSPTEGRRHKKKIRKAIYRRFADRRHAMGLTVRGMLPRYRRGGRQRVLTPLEQLHASLRAEIKPVIHVEDYQFEERRFYR